jgi:hypothetical protein
MVKDKAKSCTNCCGGKMIIDDNQKLTTYAEPRELNMPKSGDVLPLLSSYTICKILRIALLYFFMEQF